MNIIDSIGVMLGGDASPFHKMMDDADKRIEAFDRKMTNWSGKMSLYVSTPLMAAGTRNVFLFAAQEKAIMGLQAQLGKVSAKPFVDFSNTLQDALGKDNDQMISLMSRFAAMGVSAKNLKSTTVNTIGLSAATGMGEFQAFRAMQMLKQGSTALFARYIPGMNNLSKEQQTIKVNELINRGLAKTRAEMMGTAGSFKSMKLAMDDASKTSGEMISKHLRLPELFRRMVGFYKSLESHMRNMSDGTQQWTIRLMTALAVVGPLTLAYTKMANIIRSLSTAMYAFGRAILTTVLPAVLIIGSAFLGWELGKTLSDAQLGMFKLGQWVELIVDNMQMRWDRYFGFIKAGFKSFQAEQKLSAAYGNKSFMGIYPSIDSTRSTKQTIRDLIESGLKLEVSTARMAYNMDPNAITEQQLNWAEQQLTTNPDLKKLTAEIQKMTRPGTDNAEITRLETEYESINKNFTEYNKPGGAAASIVTEYEKRLRDRMGEFLKANIETPGIRTPKEFLDKFYENIEKDFKGIGPSIKKLISQYFPEFKPPELKAGKDGTPDFKIGGVTDKPFAAALAEGTQEAYSAIFGNASKQDAMLEAQERTADGVEEMKSFSKQLLDFVKGGDTAVPSLAMGGVR